MKGLTLVEILVTLVIFTFIFAAVFRVLLVGQAAWHTDDTEAELIQEIRKATGVMDRQLRQSSSYVIQGVPANDNYYTSITFKVPFDTDGDGDVISATGAIEWSGDIVYSRNAGNQILRTDQSGTSILANNITSLEFKRPSGNPDVVQIYITAAKNTAEGRSLQRDIVSMVKMRN